MSRARFPGHAHFQTFPDIDSACSLIGPGDPPPWMSYNDHGSAPVLLVADHASPFFPAAMNQLGLADWVLERHVAWDIGVDELVRALADRVEAEARVRQAVAVHRLTVAIGAVSELVSEEATSYEATFVGAVPVDLRTPLEAHHVASGASWVRVAAENRDTLIEELNDRGAKVVSFAPVRTTLEDLLMRHYEGIGS